MSINLNILTNLLEKYWLPYLAKSIGTSIHYEINCYSYPGLTSLSKEPYKIAIVLSFGLETRISSLYFRPYSREVIIEYGVKKWEITKVNPTTIIRLATKLNNFSTTEVIYPSYWATRIMGIKGQEVGADLNDIWICCGQVIQNVTTTDLLAHVWVTFLYEFTTGAILSLIDRLESEATLEGLL
jgi:hypothetical protein